jgi:hypothetical protein
MAEMLPLLELTKEEKGHLMHIYRSRLYPFLITYVAIAAFIGARIAGEHQQHIQDSHHSAYETKRSDYLFTDNEGTLVYASFFTLLFAIPGIRIFKRRIWRFRKDAINGVKEIVPYTIIRKSYFEHIGKFYISFYDPNYMHHEVDAAFFLSCSEGDTAYLFRAPLSKYIFNKDGKFELM